MNLIWRFEVAIKEAQSKNAKTEMLEEAKTMIRQSYRYQVLSTKRRKGLEKFPLGRETHVGSLAWDIVCWAEIKIEAFRDHYLS